MLDSTLIRGNSTGLNRAARFVSTLKYQTRPQHEQVCVDKCMLGGPGGVCGGGEGGGLCI